MRVIAGSAGGIGLAVPKRGVRPTMDRVKTAIFSSLAMLLLERESSTFSREAAPLELRRSAAARLLLFLFEGDGQSAEIIESNLAKTKLKGRIRQQDVFDFLRHASGAELFDIVFADPPYEKTEDGERFTEKLLANEALSQLMDADGIFVLEKRPAEALPEMKRWHLVRQKTYGATEVLFLSGVRNQKFGIRN
jgi:N6-adenine-specific methylase